MHSHLRCVNEVFHKVHDSEGPDASWNRTDRARDFRNIFKINIACQFGLPLTVNPHINDTGSMLNPFFLYHMGFSSGYHKDIGGLTKAGKIFGIRMKLRYSRIFVEKKTSDRGA